MSSLAQLRLAEPSAPSARQTITGTVEWCSRLSAVEPKTALASALRPRFPTTTSCALSTSIWFSSAAVGLVVSTKHDAATAAAQRAALMAASLPSTPTRIAPVASEHSVCFGVWEPGHVDAIQ